MVIPTRHPLLGILLLLLSIPPAQAQSVRALLDRNEIFLGETVLLTIEVDSEVRSDTPDVGQLTRDFEILDSRRSQRIEVIDNRRREQQQWLFELAPKRVGDLTIPALSIGPRLNTPELNLTVLPEPDDQPISDLVFIEVAAEPRDPYVHSQVRYSERIFLATGLRDNALSRDAPIEGAVVQPLGDFREYVAQRDGRNYRVYERSFALLPERSGELVLPGLALRGRVADNRNSLSRGRLIEARSEPVTLIVRPQPNDYSGAHWLPSPELHLTEDWSTEEFRVGEPITRTLRLSARGLDAAQLPDLAVPDLDWARVYPDQPETETRHDGSWLQSRWEQRQALVPNAAGEFELPALRLVWWDTAADRERVAELPARTVTVLPTATAAEPLPPIIAPPPEPQAAPAPVVVETGAAGFWPWLSAALLGVWVLTLLGWWRERRRRSPPAHPAETLPRARTARTALRDACRNGDRQAAAHALLDWARAEWPDSPPTSLGALAARLPRARPVILDLDRALYAADAANWRGEELWRVVRAGLRESPPEPTAPRSALPPLYPRRG
jgi:hypothetical protein